jgi:hypothetical protein
MRASSIGTLAALLIVVPAQARADASGKEADVLFNEGRALMLQNNYAEACPKLERSEALDPGIGTALNLARCYDLAGKPASAWAMYQRVIDATHVAGQTERESAARELQRGLLGRLSRLTIRPSLAAAKQPGLEIRCDGVLVTKASWGESVPIDPGTHVVQATAPDGVPWRTTFAIERDAQRVDLEVPALASKAPALVPIPPLAAEPASVPASTQRIIAAVLGGAGLVGVGVGSYFGLHSLALHSRDGCAGDVCDPAGAQVRNDARTEGTRSTVSFVVGGVLIAAAAVVWITAPSSRGAPARRAQRACIQTEPSSLFGESCPKIQ